LDVGGEMGLVEVSKGRATVSTGADGLRIIIPSRKNVFVIVFLLVWLGGWFFGETSAIRSLVQRGTENQGFLAFWLLGWTAGGAFAALAWLWNLAGREILELGSGKLVYQRAVGPLKLTKTYDLSHIKDMRAVPLPGFMQGGRNGFNALGLTGGPIAFDYGASTIHVGAGVEEAEAKSLVQTIRARYNV
jgi:hypothetical protein